MARENTGGAGTEQMQIAIVSVDKSDREILQLNIDKGFQMEWNPDDFRPLPEEVWSQLTPRNMAAYIKAKTLYDNARLEQKSKTSKVLLNPLNPIEGDPEARLFIRKREGWHQCWKNPGREYEAAIAGKYVTVKLPGPKQSAKTVVPGEEDGEVLKRFNSEGKVESIAVECPLEAFEGYLQYISDASRSRTESITDDFAAGIEKINRGIRKKDTRIEALDGQGRPLL